MPPRAPYRQNAPPRRVPAPAHNPPVNGPSGNCYNCGKPGHFMNDCTQRRERMQAMEEETTPDDVHTIQEEAAQEGEMEPQKGIEEGQDDLSTYGGSQYDPSEEGSPESFGYMCDPEDDEYFKMNHACIKVISDVGEEVERLYAMREVNIESEYDPDTAYTDSTLGMLSISSNDDYRHEACTYIIDDEPMLTGPIGEDDHASAHISALEHHIRILMNERNMKDQLIDTLRVDNQ
ncbi:hypothetical protein NEOLEDRAFT_1179685 [Neolentinus lepideus HHB14362 ss-1]|uniref:CCHC-type domain-containing protein n=1 Tax=Neolentinus lepideus HHB14362 ss-1 TaxID=1314782 RepID=A0A165RKB6_9AGAM|nr:hypothetical protein NEOLEDRAFT_1179685 [Neolentinus lepideus HHB14362 ss-1]